MTKIDLKKVPYSVKNKVIYVSEKNVPFGTKYSVISDKTSETKEFNFECSTGPEFDPKTEWVYKSSEGFKLHICNDAEMTKIAADNYLKAKLR
mgnify:CR=1 FL=1